MSTRDEVGAARIRSAARALVAQAETGELDGLLERLDVRLLTLHGSAARADSAPADLDLAVLHGPGGELLATVDALTALVRLDAVDVMDLGRAGPVARAEALGPACVPLYESVRGLFAEQQVRALTERMETAHLRRLDRALLAR